MRYTAATANEVGYEEGSFFRRLFRRKVGLSPDAYRLRFGRPRMTCSERSR